MDEQDADRDPTRHASVPRDPSERPTGGRGGRGGGGGAAWAFVVIVSLVVAVVTGVYGARALTPDCERSGCPSLDALRSYRPSEPPRIYDANGNLAGMLSGPRRIVVSLDAVPPLVREGYVAVEDRRFRQHGGFDLAGALRALNINLRAGGVAEGASTITMQLARNVFGAEVLDWGQFHRKLSEIRLARIIEAQLTKDEILELYLNQIYLGDGVYGVETAAQHYFGKPVSEVGTREAALLIGLAKNPEGYNPRTNPAAADARIEIILEVLVREGVISADDAEAARAQSIEVVEAEGTPDWGDNAYYLSAVRRELRALYPNPAHREGLQVHTGLDARAQSAAVEALVSQIRAIESGRWGTFRHAAAGETLTRTASSPYLQGMVVVMDAETGLVRTLVGGRDYRHSEFDRAFQALRQPGSAFKPVIYAAALSAGLRLSDVISTEAVRVSERGAADWVPSDHVAAGEVTVREALVRSSNTAAVRVGQQVGVDRVAEQARRLGISTPIPPYPSVFLGAAEVFPAELVASFAAFGNGGHRIEPHLITYIEDPHGHVVHRSDARRTSRVLDERVAFLVLDVMRDVVRRGTGWRVGSSGLSYPAAGKTGTTNDSRDAWFIGMTPGAVAGVWIGFDDPRTIVRGGGGGDLAAPVWARVMQTAGGGGGGDWQTPSGVVRVEIDAGTGYALSEDCPAAETRWEYFMRGTEPNATCPTPDPYRYYWDTLPYGQDTSAVSPDGSEPRDGPTFWRGGPDGRPRGEPVDTVRMEPLPRRDLPDTLRIPTLPPIRPRPRLDTVPRRVPPPGAGAEPAGGEPAEGSVGRGVGGAPPVSPPAGPPRGRGRSGGPG